MCGGVCVGVCERVRIRVYVHMRVLSCVCVRHTRVEVKEEQGVCRRRPLSYARWVDSTAARVRVSAPRNNYRQ